MDLSLLHKTQLALKWAKLALQGQKLSAIVESKSKPHEYAKFRMHLEDLDRINGLFFSLQTRLTKIEAEILQADQFGTKVCC